MHVLKKCCIKISIILVLVVFCLSSTTYITYASNYSTTEEYDPRVSLWTQIRTAKGYIGVPVGTYVPGSSAYFVKLLQSTLNTLGYNCGTADGICGSNTQQAIRNFQSANDLAVDGVAGKETWVTASDLIILNGKVVPF